MTITALATKKIAKPQLCGKNMALRKIALLNRINILLLAITFVSVSASAALAADAFSITPSVHDNLIIFGPKGDQVADLSVPTISQAVTVGGTSFQISFGRDANNYLTAILAPSAGQPQDLHFTVLGKTVEASKQAVITLTFPDTKHVIVDPGYVGTVTVNSHPLSHRNLADAPPAPTHVTPTPATPAAPATPRVTADVQPRDIPAPVYKPAPAPAPIHRQVASTAPAQPAASAPTASDSQTASDQQDESPSLVPPPLVGSMFSQPPTPLPKSTGGATAPSKSLFWAEPVTPPSGPAPVVGINQMKLVSVQGPVSVEMPDGEKKTGKEGMLIPSGATVATSENSSAAVFIGGVDSARLLPNTEVKVSQNLDGSKRKTDINMKVGTIFARVGHRPGETQDFQVRTPQGVAAARGTSFAVNMTLAGGHPVMVVATQEGVVTLTDANGHVVTVTPLGVGQLAVGSTPEMSTADLSTLLVSFLTTLQQFNANMQAIANNPNPTPQQQAYYAANTGFNGSTQLLNADTGTVSVLFNAPSGTDLFDDPNAINLVVPAARSASNQMLVPFGTIPLTPF